MEFRLKGPGNNWEWRRPPVSFRGPKRFAAWQWPCLFSGRSRFQGSRNVPGRELTFMKTAGPSSVAARKRRVHKELSYASAFTRARGNNDFSITIVLHNRR